MKYTFTRKGRGSLQMIKLWGKRVLLNSLQKLNKNFQKKNMYDYLITNNTDANAVYNAGILLVIIIKEKTCKISLNFDQVM